MNRLITAMTIAALGCAMPAKAQTARDNEVFDSTVQAFAGSGRAHIYQCKGPSGKFESETHHGPALVGIARELAAGAAVAVARRSGCQRSNDAGPSKAFSGETLHAVAVRTADAVWLIGDLNESYPQATGYSFEGIVRIPMTRPATSAAPAAGPSVTTPAAREADAVYMKRDGTRKMAGSDEGSGYNVCQTADQVTAVIDAGTVAPEDVRDERMLDIMAARKCRQGNKVLTGFHARRYVESMGTYWYGGQGVEDGRTVQVIVWIN